MLLLKDKERKRSPPLLTMTNDRVCDWVRKYPIYQIYPRSFMDSSGNGTGDLKGIISRLNYLQWLGIKSVWLSPVYPSPMKDFGYDVSDFCDIDPLFGNLDDFKQLIDCMHKSDMYLIMDLVPNHTSNEHDWFKKSVQNILPYKDYYIWKDPKIKHGKREPPNNWDSVFTGSAWTWVESRQQYYYHAFLPEQPDLNYRNAEVRDQMCKVFKFWMDLGVDGFRIDAVSHLMQHADFPDNPVHTHSGFSRKKKKKLYDRDLPEVFELIKEWVGVVRDYGKTHNKHILMMTEAYCSDEDMKLYYEAGVDWPFNFKLIDWSRKDKLRKRKGWDKASDLRGDILSWMRIPLSSQTDEYWSNWVMSNHDQPRISTRLGGSKFAKVANMLLLLLPGTPTVYYGDELGLENIFVSYDQIQDPFGINLGPKKYIEGNRDPCRSPMPWNNEKFAGFTHNENGAWLPLNSDYETRNVEAQKCDPSSVLNLFQRLLELRNNASLSGSGNELVLMDFKTENILAFLRISHPNSGFLVILNIGKEWKTVKFTKAKPKLVCMCPKHKCDPFKCSKAKVGCWSEYSYETVIDSISPNCDFQMNLNGFEVESGRGIVFEMCK